MLIRYMSKREFFEKGIGFSEMRCYKLLGVSSVVGDWVCGGRRSNRWGFMVVKCDICMF